MVKVWFPSMYMRLISLKMKKSPPEAVLQIPPSMTKTEVREYLTKIYEIPVLKISTMNYLGNLVLILFFNVFIGFAGKWKRLYAKRKIVSYKRRNFKVATVQFEDAKV
jgi:large subunit ribosomal protein L23